MAKSIYSLSAMKKTLQDNGIETTKDAKDIVKKWEEFARDPKNKDAYLIAQDKIQENLSYMGESTIFNKSMSEAIRKTNFQALTGYVNGQVNKTLTDLGKVLGLIETGGTE